MVKRESHRTEEETGCRGEAGRASTWVTYLLCWAGEPRVLEREPSQLEAVL